MGAHEDELARIRAAGPFAAPELGALRASLAALARTIKDVAASPGWAGLSAEAASAHLEDLSRRYLELEATIGGIQAEVDRANAIRAAALADYDALPSAKAPAWVHGTLDAFDFPGIPQPVDLAQGGLAIIEGFLGGQREQAAGRILDAYEAALRAPAARTETLRVDLRDIGSTAARLEWPPDDDTGGAVETGSWTNGGVYRGDGYQGVEYVYDVPRPAAPRPDVAIGVDDRGTGVTPGGGPGGRDGSGDGGDLADPSGPGALPGGVPGTGIGVGVGAAAAGAGALAVARLTGGAAAAGAAGARLGSGGLLGAGTPGMPPASGAAAGRPGGVAATHRSAGQGLLGAGGTTGGAREKDRPQGARGLGGPIAPTLDDDGEVVLPGAGARAGARDAAATEPEAPGADGTDLAADG